MSPAADLIVVGAGPAGVSAALMADSLGMRTIVIEADKVGGKLHVIGALENVPGGWTNGPALAERYAHDLARIERTGNCRLMEGRAVRIIGHDDRAEVVLEDGKTITATAIVVATGVRSLTPQDTPWVTYPERLPLPPLWRSHPEHLAGNGSDLEMTVLGGDRPLGTWLRAHPDADVKVRVLYPPSDEYKVAEVAGDPYVQLLPTEHVTVTGNGETYGLTLSLADGSMRRLNTWNLLGNLGNKPASIAGLAQGADGYCPPEQQQHPRILTAGDLRSARYQRIVTAQGSGAQAALSRYYDIALTSV